MATQWEIINSAHEVLGGAVAAVPDDGWLAPTPCPQWNATQVLQHVVAGQLAYAAAIRGVPGPSFEDMFMPSGKLEEPPDALLNRALQEVTTAFAGVDSGAAKVPSPLPEGAVPAWLAAGACALDAAVHAWDIAIATGQPSPLHEVLCDQLSDVSRTIVDPLRVLGGYAPALPAQAGDAADARLLRYLGRSPDWGQG
jgi:uncharacterized protein (TIGR03086 family)